MSVAVGDVTLQPGRPPTASPPARDIAFTVEVPANQGENDESDVDVARHGSRGAGTRPITAQQDGRPDERRARTPRSPSRSAQAPPIGTPGDDHRRGPCAVPGEETADNNRQTYTAIFTR